MKEVEGAVEGFEPSLSFNNFGESGIDCTVVMRAKEFPSQSKIKHEFIKRLYSKFKEKGINIALDLVVIQRIASFLNIPISTLLEVDKGKNKA